MDSSIGGERNDQEKQKKRVELYPGFTFFAGSRRVLATAVDDW